MNAQDMFTCSAAIALAVTTCVTTAEANPAASPSVTVSPVEPDGGAFFLADNAPRLRTDPSQPQVRCYRALFHGKDSCKGKDAEGYIVDRPAHRTTTVGAYFMTDARTCHEAGLTTTPPPHA